MDSAESDRPKRRTALVGKELIQDKDLQRWGRSKTLVLATLSSEVDAKVRGGVKQK